MCVCVCIYIYIYIYVYLFICTEDTKLNVEFTLEQVKETQRGSRCIVALSLASALERVSVQRQVLAALIQNARYIYIYIYIYSFKKSSLKFILLNVSCSTNRVQLICDGTRWRTVGEVIGETDEWSG